MKVAIVGTGIAGLAAAHSLRGHAALTLFEAGAHFGGHAQTVDVCLDTPAGPITHGVDTGFLVFNERTYPGLIALFEQLQVATAPSEMSFSVQSWLGERPLMWSGSNLQGLFAQRRNVLRPAFWAMLSDLWRFNRLTMALASQGSEAALTQSLGDFLAQHRFGTAFRDGYLLPMLACIWSCPTAQMLQFPVATLIRFCANHGLLQITQRPQWWTVQGGSRHYVERIMAGVDQAHLNTPVLQVERHSQGVRLHTRLGAASFDKVIFATHADQSLSLLAQPSAQEQALLGAFRFQANRAVLHTDASVLPARRAAWAAWNYERSAASQSSPRVCLHYLINRLQPLPWQQPVIVSLNPIRPIPAEHVLGDYEFAHPIFDAQAIAAQPLLGQLQGQQHSYFCGAWMGYGFHEDGFQAGLAAAQALLAQRGATQALAA